jgi:hypothetical protein
MSTTGPADGLLSDALMRYAAEKFSGVLRVEGQPGGTIYLANGGISACETPGAPGLEAILLRSGRLSESAWDTAFTAAAVADRHMTAELVQRGLIGAGELEALLRTTLADTIFAIVNGEVGAWHTEALAAGHALPLVPAARPGWLLAEATRRAQVLASFKESAVNAQDRVAATPTIARGPDRVAGQGRHAILTLADGRRTARDLAFSLGRGLYATMLELSRMRTSDLIVVISYDKDPAPDDESGGQTPGSEDSHGAVAGLPRRRKDRAVPARTREPGRRDASVWMLRPRSEGDQESGGTQ